jgi:hypothetical protein
MTGFEHSSESRPTPAAEVPVDAAVIAGDAGDMPAKLLFE